MLTPHVESQASPLNVSDSAQSTRKRRLPSMDPTMSPVTFFSRKTLPTNTAFKHSLLKVSYHMVLQIRFRVKRFRAYRTNFCPFFHMHISLVTYKGALQESS